MGLGLLGRGLGDTIFLAEHGAEIIVTDLRDEKTLRPSLDKLKRYKDIRYTIGKHKLGDFRNRDLIIKAAGVHLDSPYIAEAVKHTITIEMDASLFAKLMPKGVTLVGITGTRGKSTVTALIYEILSRGVKDTGSRIKDSARIFKGGNLVPEATLPLLAEVRAGDIVVLELDSWQLQGFHDAKISPHVAVFTTFLDDHLIYYKGDSDRYFEDKVAIFKYQKAGDVLIAGKHVSKRLSSRFDLKSGKRSNLKRTFTVARASDIPQNWNILIPGEHNLENVACALNVAEYFKISREVVQKAVENFKAVSGRLEFIREVRGVKIYNDNNATTPDATLAGLRALGDLRFRNNDLRIETPTHKSKILNPKSIILIMGGTDKGLDMSKLVAEIPKHCKAVVLLKETGTDKLLSEFPGLKSPLIKGVAHSDVPGVVVKETLKECVEETMKVAKRGDIILFSPAFASFGKWFKNEYDRGEQFMKLVKDL